MKIAIASGKGGTGKTTLSTNLASLMAKSAQVILVDLDVEEPNSGLFIDGKLFHKEDKFKLVPDWNHENCTACGHCQKVCNFHAVLQLGKQIMVFPELCHSCFSCSDLCPVKALPMTPRKMGTLQHFVTNNFNFVESKLDIGQEQAVPLIAQTKQYVETHFNDDFIILMDSPPGTSCPVIEVTKDVDYVILVTEPTPFGLHDLKLAVETVRELNKPFGVVINRCGIGNEGVHKYCLDEGIDVLAKLANDRKIAEFYSTGKLIYPSFPEFKNQLTKIADFILNLQTGGSA
jgi:MinD superfamily P-loop ATPase